MNKLIFILVVVASFAAQADNVREINDFSIVRTGGGATIIEVHKTSGPQIAAVTMACDYRTLTPAEQQKTMFVLSPALVAQAAFILQDQQVEYAQRVQLQPISLTGTFVSLTVDYYDSETHNVMAQTITDPVVLLNGAVSNVLADIETAARQASSAAGVCK